MSYLNLSDEQNSVFKTKRKFQETANSPAIINMTSTNLDKAFQRVASMMKTLSRPSSVQTNVGLSTSKFLEILALKITLFTG